MKVLVTGGTGSIGSALVRRLLKREDVEVVRILSRDDTRQYELAQSVRPEDGQSKLRTILGDVRNKDIVRSLVKDCNIVFHCAALKHVVGSAYNAMEVNSVNVEGTHNVLHSANEAANYPRMVLLSTDKAANPLSVMAASKLIAEKVMQHSLWASNVDRRVVRFGNVWCSRGSVFPTMLKAGRSCLPLVVTSPKVTRYIITIEDAVDTLVYAGFTPHKEIQESCYEWCPNLSIPTIIPIMRSVDLGTIHKAAIRVLVSEGISPEVKTIGLMDNEALWERCLAPHEYELFSGVTHKNEGKRYYILNSNKVPKDDLVPASLTASYNAQRISDDELIDWYNKTL